MGRLMPNYGLSFAALALWSLSKDAGP